MLPSSRPFLFAYPLGVSPRITRPRSTCKFSFLDLSGTPPRYKARISCSKPASCANKLLPGMDDTVGVVLEKVSSPLRPLVEDVNPSVSPIIDACIARVPAPAPVAESAIPALARPFPSASIALITECGRVAVVSTYVGYS